MPPLSLDVAPRPSAPAPPSRGQCASTPRPTPCVAIPLSGAAAPPPTRAARRPRPAWNGPPPWPCPPALNTRATALPRGPAACTNARTRVWSARPGSFANRPPPWPGSPIASPRAPAASVSAQPLFDAVQLLTRRGGDAARPLARSGATARRTRRPWPWPLAPTPSKLVPAGPFPLAIKLRPSAFALCWPSRSRGRLWRRPAFFVSRTRPSRRGRPG
mmetsp:Transcript_88195/g.248189  ORF Transcript_88195/g.248189 Transcript_88195/m.248189 type:complete len:217 (+) Transcript_88195:1167-1817(+)